MTPLTSSKTFELPTVGAFSGVRPEELVVLEEVARPLIVDHVIQVEIERRKTLQVLLVGGPTALAPFDLDLDNMVDDQWSGYFFEYNKLFWAYTGERTTVGSSNVFEDVNGVMVQGQFAEVIYRQNPQDEGVSPLPYLVQNGLDNAGPHAGFAMGDRYEIGYRDGGHGWLVGILDGPQLNQRQNYGFTRHAEAACHRSLMMTTPAATTSAQAAGLSVKSAFGFGSVPVLFETPAGYLQGFRDYLQNLGGAQAGTVGGPLLYVGNYGNPVFTEDATDTGTLFRRADDLDGDGLWGSVLIVNPDGTIGTITDFDDLHTFNIFFDSVTVRNKTDVEGVEAMWTHDIKNQNYMAKIRTTGDRSPTCAVPEVVRRLPRRRLRQRLARCVLGHFVRQPNRWPASGHAVGQSASTLAARSKRSIHGGPQYCQLAPGWLDRPRSRSRWTQSAPVWPDDRVRPRLA